MHIYHICLSTLTFWNWSAMLIYGMLYMIYTCTDSAYNRVKEEDSCGWTCPRGWKRWQAYNSMSVPANVRFTEEGGSFRVATAVAAGSNRITRAKCQLSDLADPCSQWATILLRWARPPGPEHWDLTDLHCITFILVAVVRFLIPDIQYSPCNSLLSFLQCKWFL